VGLLLAQVPRMSHAEPVTRDVGELPAQLLAHELRPVPADPRARARYARFRDATEPHIRAYARNIGYPVAAVWETYDRRTRNGALEERTPGAAGDHRAA
jgi:hypothetical protein